MNALQPHLGGGRPVLVLALQARLPGLGPEGLHDPGVADVVRLAGEAGLNPSAVQGCLEDPATDEALRAQIAEGRRLDVRATPTLYVNGKKLPRINDFVAVVDREVQRKGFAPLNP